MSNNVIILMKKDNGLLYNINKSIVGGRAMAAIILEQYLNNILKVRINEGDELALTPADEKFSWLTLWLENQTTGLHFYQPISDELLFAYQGKVNLTVNGKELALSQGDVLLLKAGSSYQVGSEIKRALLLKFKFQSQFFIENFVETLVKSQSEQTLSNRFKQTITQDRSLLFTTRGNNKVVTWLNEMAESYLQDTEFVESFLQADLTRVLINLIRHNNLTNTKAGVVKVKFSQAALDDYIADHYQKLTLQDAATYFGFNRNYFSNLVKLKTGKSFVDHVDERRMQEAKMLLAQPDISLRDIITRVGYSSKSFFYKKFGEYYHMTPAAMRSELFRQANINLK